MILSLNLFTNVQFNEKLPLHNTHCEIWLQMGTKKCFVSPMVWPNYNMMTKLKWAKLRIGLFTVWSETVHLVYGWLHASKVPQKPFLFFFRLIRSFNFLTSFKLILNLIIFKTKKNNNNRIDKSIRRTTQWILTSSKWREPNCCLGKNWQKTPWWLNVVVWT